VSRFVFLDRDGTLVRDTGYPHRREDYELLTGTAAALRQLAAAGWGLAIVTNQSGIGRGLFTEGDFQAFQDHLLRDLRAQGVEIAATYHCPHAPGAGCDCRKPEPGLLHRARNALGAELERCWFVGDGDRDVAVAFRAGCRGAVRVGAVPGAPPPGEHPPLFYDASDLAEAVRRILAERT
jgi:D-glycero-D-manno-heptose 1,7-bisphosphate phosphatase